MTRLGRRDAMIRLALGSAGLVACGRPAPPPAGRKLDGLDDLAGRIRSASAPGVFDVAAEAIRSGVDPNTLLAASFVAGVQDIRPHGVGGKFHAVLMVESAYQLAAISSVEDAYLVALWALWDFKRCQERDRQEEGDWVLPPRPEVTFASETAARRELAAAMTDWDVERADRAIVGLLPFHDRVSLFELLWPYGARCYADLGHKMIFCAHAERTLARLDPQQAEPALRSLIRGLLFTDDDGPRMEVFEESQGRLEAFGSNWLDGVEDPALSEELLRSLRQAGPGASQQLVVDALREGLGPRTIWDGLRLHAAEVFHRRPATAARRHGPVHPVTELNAFAYAWRTTGQDETRKLMILQITGWLALLRDDLVSIFGPQEGQLLDTLGDEIGDEAPAMADLFQEPSPAAARARIDRDPDGGVAFLGQLRSWLLQRAFQDHQYKFVAVLHEEAAAIDPRWVSRLLAPSISYVPTARDPETEMLERSRHALRSAGVV